VGIPGMAAGRFGNRASGLDEAAEVRGGPESGGSRACPLALVMPPAGPGGELHTCGAGTAAIRQKGCRVVGCRVLGKLTPLCEDWGSFQVFPLDDRRGGAIPFASGSG
jgi:hypothetical protein